MSFELKSDFLPAGDQPNAIEKLILGIKTQIPQTLLGVTGSGKTFTMANIIARVKKPTLILSHNKSLAGQLYEEFKSFFPNANVGFFISYYDYYQPESYIVATDTYIEKDVQINEKIEQMRMNALSDLVSFEDTIIIASISCIYGIGDPKAFKEYSFEIKIRENFKRDILIQKLIDLHYERNDIDLKSGRFRVRGDVIDIIQGGGKSITRVEFFEDVIEKITARHTVSCNLLEELKSTVIFPASAYVYTGISNKDAISSIRQELNLRLPELNPLEAYRLKQRTEYDLELIEQVGFCKGIENYSKHFEGRKTGEPPSCLLDFFPNDFLFFIDESHVTLPQVHGMYKGDKSRKETLIENGFRLPSAFDNRPLKFSEFEKYLDKAIFVSATPSDYELQKSGQIVEQIIRPTGLVDPPIEIHKSDGQIQHLIEQINETVKKGFRVLVTTLTKRMSEELNDYFLERGIKSHYLHSEIDTLERIAIIKDLRLGKFDVLIGINLLREGLDLPEVALVAILDADKEGFLRTDKSLIQTIGRCARNLESKVIMYADKKTESMKRAILETNRRRKIQIQYNKENKITPKTILKTLKDGLTKDGKDLSDSKNKRTAYSIEEEIIRIESEMLKYAEKLDFEKAIELREKLKVLSTELSKNS